MVPRFSKQLSPDHGRCLGDVLGRDDLDLEIGAALVSVHGLIEVNYLAAVSCKMRASCWLWSRDRGGVAF